MVGVPGGSRGCARCRRRKVKCDQARPTCQRCARAGLECGGYPDNFLHDPRSSSHEQRRSPSGTRSTSQASKSPANLEPDDLEPDESELVDAEPAYAISSMIRRERNSNNRTVPLLHNNWMPEFLDLLPFSDNICVSYASVNILKGAGKFRNVKHPFVLPGLANLRKDGLAKNCILAISRTYFGQQHHQTDIAKDGLSLYSSALKDLNGVLGDSKKNRTLEIFEAIVIMILYEYLVARKTVGWVSHALGLETLLKSYGPGAFNTPSTVGFFENVREMIVNAAMLSSRTTILSEPDWKTIPWADRPEDKSELQHLFDIFVDLPELTMQTTGPLGTPLELRPGHTMDVDTMYRKSVDLLRKLDQWRRMWYNKNYEEFFEAQPTYTPKGWIGRTEELNWKTVWHFSTLYEAQAYAVYHAILILLLRMISNLEQSGLLSLDHPKVDRTFAIYMAGIEICRCVDFHLIEAQSGAGSLLILMPLRCAWKTIGENSIESQWLEAVVADISVGDRGRWAIAGGTLGEWKFSRSSNMAHRVFDNTLPSG